MTIRDKLNKYKVLKNTSVMTLAQVASRVAMIFYLAALARYVGADGVGQISTATALNAMLLLIVGPGLTILLIREVAADHAKTPGYISNAILLRLILIIPFAALTTLIAHLSHYPPETIILVHLYTAVFILDSLTEVLIATFRAFERMEFEAGIQIARDFSNIALSLVAIALGWPLVAIVAISIVAQLIKLGLSVYVLVRHIGRFRPRLDLSFSKRLLVMSIPFGVLLIIQTVQAEFGTYVLSLNRPAEIVGYYAAANTLILMLLFVPNSFAAAIFPSFSRLHRTSLDGLRAFYRVCYKYLLVLGFPLAVGTLLVGERAIVLVYGEEFAGSGPVIRIMAIFLFTIVGYANGALLYATDKQRFYAWTQGAAALFNAALCLLLVPPFGAVGTAIALTASGLLTFYVHSRACHRLLALPMPWAVMLRVFAASLAMAASVFVALEIGMSWIVAAVGLAPAVYLLSLVVLNVLNGDELRLLAGGSAEPPAERVEDHTPAQDAQPVA